MNTAVAHITLATRDVVRSRDFFANVLGWRPVQHPGNIDIEAAWLDINDRQQLHLIRVADFEASPFEREFGRHFAIEVPLADFEALKARLEEYSATLIEPLRETPVPRFFFLDPNGYVIEVVPAD